MFIPLIEALQQIEDFRAKRGQRYPLWFYRVERARSQEQGGTGLGLAIAQSIVQRHGGTLTVESEVEKDSMFIIQLPLSN